MKKGRRSIAVIIICLVAVIAIVSSTFAWYSSTNSMTQLASIGNFQTYVNVYFENESGNVTATTDADGFYVLSTDPQDVNYIGKLKVNVVHKGYLNAYVRVKMNVQWTMPDGTVIQNVLLPFTFAEKWYDNRANDYCVYYTEDTGLFANHDKSIIESFDGEKFAAETLSEVAVPKLAITAESVQINRYPQFWGMETLPWEQVEETISAVTE